MLIKIKSLFPVKFKTFIKKFRKFNGYNNLDKQMLNFINYENGFFVDIGANDGVNQSTTWYYEKTLNWNGILIEPLPHIFKELKKNRSKQNFYFNCAAVSREFKDEEIKISHDEDSLTAQIEKYETTNENKKTISVKAKTIKKILNSVISNKQKIDFFSLDVEGLEMNVLKGIDFKKNYFNYILIETYKFEKVKKFLNNKNYHFLKKLSVHDYLFKINKNKII